MYSLAKLAVLALAVGVCQASEDKKPSGHAPACLPPILKKHSTFICNKEGQVRHEKPYTSVAVGGLTACETACLKDSTCKSLGYTAKNKKCHLYKDGIHSQTFKAGTTGTIFFNTHCFKKCPVISTSSTKSGLAPTTLSTTHKSMHHKSKHHKSKHHKSKTSSTTSTTSAAPSTTSHKSKHHKTKKHHSTVVTSTSTSVKPLTTTHHKTKHHKSKHHKSKHHKSKHTSTTAAPVATTSKGPAPTCVGTAPSCSTFYLQGQSADLNNGDYLSSSAGSADFSPTTLLASKYQIDSNGYLYTTSILGNNYANISPLAIGSFGPVLFSPATVIGITGSNYLTCNVKCGYLSCAVNGVVYAFSDLASALTIGDGIPPLSNAVTLIPVC